ncbi:MAG: hypothetical protein AAF636_22190 [Pseudomonadota bacterium]
MKRLVFAAVIATSGTPALADPCPGIRDLAWVSMYLRQNSYTFEDAMERMVNRFAERDAIGAEAEWRVFFHLIGADAWQSAVHGSPKQQQAAADVYAEDAERQCRRNYQNETAALSPSARLN